MTAHAPVAPVRAGFLPHVHLLRAVAILLVVGAHCWPDFAWTPDQRRWILLLFDNVTVVFVFISGLLFRHLIGRFDYRRYLKHRFSIVILPYVIVSIPAIVVAVWFQHRSGVWPWLYRLPAWEQVVVYLLTGKHLAPLWFMPMIALFILAAPLFVWVDRRDAYRWLLPVTVAIATILGRDSAEGLLSVFGKAIFMLPAYLAGMAFGRHRVAAEAWVARRAWSMLAGLTVVSLAILLDRTSRIDLTLIQKLLLAPLLLVALRRVPARARGVAAAGVIADMSFAIYFVHGYVISLFRMGWDRATGASADAPPFHPNWIGLLLHIVAVVALCVALIRVAQIVLGRRSRSIIGA